MKQLLIDFDIKLTTGQLYTIDGLILKLISVNKSGLALFQQLNNDFTDYVEYNKNSENEETSIKDFGIRIIWKRINEIKKYEKSN